jgi:hypothetical protein
MIGCRKHVLDAGEKIARDDRLVQALVQLSQPVELAVVDRILKELVDLGLHQRRTASPVGEPYRRGFPRERL